LKHETNAGVDAKPSDALSQSSADAGNTFHFIPTRQLVLPDPEDPPSRSFQLPLYQAIAGQVASQLAFPKRLVCLGRREMNRTSMPEAAVHKNRKPPTRKCEVWMAKNQPIAAPASDFPLSQQ
jgi:hypothetical protein